MSTQINSFDLAPILIQTGYGIPDHISPLGSEYTDLYTGFKYYNIDGLTNWVQFLDSSFSGGTGGETIFSGGTVTGPTYFLNGLTANTISAITYLGLPTDLTITGGSYSNGTSVFTNNTGGTFSVTGFATTFTGVTFTGGTVTGGTSFTNGLSANTISATTYLNLPTDIRVTGSSLNAANYDFTLTRNDGVTITSNLGLLSSDMTVTGGTYDINTGIVTFTNNTGGTFNVSGFTSGMTDTYTTGGTYSNGTTTFTKTNGGTYNVSGYTYIPHLGYDNLNSTVWNYGFGGVISNISFGENSLVSNTIGESNSAFGSNILTANTTGSYNTGIGDSVLNNNTTGEYNTGIGPYSLYSNTIGVQNFSIGSYSLYSNTTGSYNTGIGTAALQDNIIGERNTAIGGFSLYVNNGSRNIAIGFYAGSATIGNDNILFGSDSNDYTDGLVSGSNNTIIGTSISGLINGSNNTIIGKPTGLSSTTTNNIIIADGSGNIRFKDDNINTILPRLAGSGNRMVIASPNGELSAITITDTTFTGGTVNGPTIFTNGLTANTISATSINRVDYMIFNTGTTSATTVPGTVYFDNTEKALSYNTSVNQGVTVNLGQQNYLRVFNNSGLDIQKGKGVELLSSYSGLPAVQLAVNRHYNDRDVVGVSAEIIPNNSEGIVLTYGIISNITVTGASIGSLVYASDTTPGEFKNATEFLNFPLTARTNSIGYIIKTGTTTGKLFVNPVNENNNLSLTDLQRNILEGNVISTGVFNFSGISLASSTTFNVSPAEGWIVDNTTNPLLPDVFYVKYTGQTNIPSLYYSSATQTYLLLTSAGTLTQQVTFPTPQQRRQSIYLAKMGHGNRTSLINAFNEPDFEVSPISQIRDMFTPIKLINENVYPSPNTGLTFNTSSGVLWGLGIGFATDLLNPSSLNISGKSPTTFQYRTQTGGTAANTTTIDPANYDLNGVITSIGSPAKQATNQRIYLLQNGQIRIQYGQTKYLDLPTAIAAVNTESFTTFSNFKDNAILIAILSIRSDATLLTDIAQAKITFASKFGESVGGTGGISTTTLQQAYNNSATPEIVINLGEGALSIKNGTGNADNVTSLLEGLNAAGNTTSFIRADGDISGTTIQTNGFIGNNNGITATTVSATTYYNLPLDIRVTGSSFNPATYYLTLTRNDGVTITSNLSILATDMTVTGGTYNINTGIVTFTNNSGGTFNVTGFTSGMTDTFVTGGTYSAGTAVFNNNKGITFNVTGFTSGNINLLNGLTANTQTFVTGTTGIDFNINSTGSTHRFNLPDASTTARGVVTINDQSFSGLKNFTDNIIVNTIKIWRGNNNSTTNIAIGTDALNNTLGNQNTIIGHRAVSPLGLASGSSFNTVVGYQAFSAGTSNNNTAIGWQSLFSTTANNNSALGYSSGLLLTTGFQNTFIGTFAGGVVGQKIDAANSTAIGYNSFTTKNNQVVLGNSGVTETVLRGKIQIDTPTTSAALYDILTRNTTSGLIEKVLSTSIQETITIGAISLIANASGASLSNGVLTLHAANATSGGVITTGTQTFGGAKTFTNGITANTISATTYLGLPTDIRVTGGTYSDGTAVFKNNTGGTFSVTGFTTGLTPSNYLVQGKLNADQTVTGNTDTIIQFIDDFDPQNWYDPATYKFIPTIAGYYNISISVWLNNPGVTNNQANVQVRKNGNSFMIIQNPLNNVTGQAFGASKIVYLNGTTDYIDSTIYQGTVSDGLILKGTADGSGTWFSANLLVGGGSGGSNSIFTGGTVAGATRFTGGLTANTISATTYLNLPTDVRVTGGTYNSGNLIFINNTGGTFNITGLTTTSGYSANYYGSFSNNNNLPVSGANTPTVWTYDTTEISNGIVIENNSQIKINNTGVYEFGYSPQIEKTQGSDADVTIWVAINGEPVTRSSSTMRLVSNSTLSLPYVAFIFSMNANDYLEFYFSSDSQYVQLTALSGLTSPTRPNSPSLIVDVKQVGNTISNTLVGAYLPLTGGTVTGATRFTAGLTSNTISATTYNNLPTDVRVTGGTYNAGGIATFTNNIGGTFNVTGFTSGGTETTNSLGALINSAGDATPLDNDYVATALNGVTGILKKISWTNVKAFLKTYFDTLYSPAIYNITITSTANINTETLGLNNSISYNQNGKNVMINNSGTDIIFSVNTGATTNFIASYTKLGGANITFSAGTASLIAFPNIEPVVILDGLAGSTALLTRTNNSYYLLINNIYS
jgi:hypothetical protein